MVSGYYLQQKGEDKMEKIQQYIKYLNHDIWNMKLNNLPQARSLGIKYLRIFILTLKGFYKDKCQLQASALTFLTLMSIVPVAAMIFGIASGFGLKKTLISLLNQTATDSNQEILNTIIEYAEKTLNSANSSVLAGVGVAVLLWTVIKLLGNIEVAFNSIWGVTKHRRFVRKLTDYLSITMVTPVLVIISSTATVMLSEQATELMIKYIGEDSFVTSSLMIPLKLLPYCSMWLLLSFIYMLMPNTKVKISSALVAGIIAGTIFHLTQSLYFESQVFFTKSNAIYGTFVSLPMFLIWLQISWLIILFGGEISFAYQNIDDYEFKIDNLTIKPSLKKTLFIHIMHLLIKDFINEKPAKNAKDISMDLNIPIKLTRQLLSKLLNAKLIVELRNETGLGPLFHPATDVNIITISYVLNAIEEYGENNLPDNSTSNYKNIEYILNSLNNEIIDSDNNKLIKDI